MDCGDVCESSGLYSDPSEIVPPENLTGLTTELRKVFDTKGPRGVNIDYVKHLMTSYKSKRDDWEKYLNWDPHKYTRNLVDEGNGNFNLMVLCWNTGQGSTIHSHANSHCFMKILDGQVNEELFEWPENEDEKEMILRGKNTYRKDVTAYISDEIGLHRIENPSHADQAVTLHLYSPPFAECKCFDQNTGHVTKGQLTFWSKFGTKT